MKISKHINYKHKNIYTRMCVCVCIYIYERERKDSVMNHLYTSSRFSSCQSYVTHASSIPFIVLG